MSIACGNHQLSWRRLLTALFLALLMALGPSVALADDAPEVSRGQWIHQLVQTFDVTVEDENYPEEYFSDVESNSQYYQDLVKAVEFGIIDVPAGGEVRADDAATREFAAHTLNFCLGFQLQDEGYSFSDAVDCEHPADDQVAVNRGWFELLEGKFEPGLAVTTDERDTAFADALEVWHSTDLDEGHENVVEFEDGVKVIPEGTQIEEPSEGTFAITDCPVTLAQGDTFAAYFMGIPRSFVVADASVSDEVTTVVTSDADASKAYETVDCEGSFEPEISEASIVVAGERGTSRRGSNDENDDPYEPFEVKVSQDKKTVSVKGKLKGKNEDYNLEGSISFEIELSNLTIDWKDSEGNRCAILRGNVDIGVNASGGFKKEMALVTIKVAGVGEIPITLELAAAGDAYIAVQNKFEGGVQWTDAGGLRVAQSFTKESFTVKAKAELSAEVKIAAGINLALFKADVYCRVGPHAEVSAQHYTDGKPADCITLAIYLKGSVGVEAKVIGVAKFDYQIKEFWNKSSSPVRLYYHYEDGVLVEKCTRGGHEDDYATGSGSRSAYRYGGGGPLGSLADGLTTGSTYEINQSTTLTRDVYLVGNLIVGADLDLAGHTLTVTGDLIHTSGTLSVTCGSMRIGGDYRMQSASTNSSGYTTYGTCYGKLSMLYDLDIVIIDGSFIYKTYNSKSSTMFQAGTLRVSGAFRQLGTEWAYRFDPSEDFHVVLDGDVRQDVDLECDYSSFASLITENPEGVSWSGHMQIGSLESDLDVVSVGNLEVGRYGRGVSLNGHTVSVSGDLRLTTDVDLCGGQLTVTGDLTQSDGNLSVTHGSLSVGGDYRIQSATTDSAGVTTYGGCDATLTMLYPEDTVSVGGDFVCKSYYGPNDKGTTAAVLQKGTLRVSDGFRQVGSEYSYRFAPADELLVVLDGSARQDVRLESSDSRIGTLWVENSQGVRWSGYIGVGSIESDFTLTTSEMPVVSKSITLKGHSLRVDGSLLVRSGIDLAGGQLTVTGDLTHSGGNLSVTHGSLSVGGDYRIQSATTDSAGITTYGGCDATLTMLYPEDTVRVSGSLYFQSTTTHGYGYLADGKLIVAGDFADLSGYFRPAGNHLTVLNGVDLQFATFPNTTAKFNRLQLMQDPQYYVFSPENCWKELVGTDYVDPRFLPQVTNIVVSPRSATLAPGDELSFSAKVYGLNGHTQYVSWTVVGARSEGTTIASDGTLTIAEDEPAGTLMVTATSLCDPTRSRTVEIEVAPIDVSLAVTHVTIMAGDTYQFVATVHGSGDGGRGVEWSVSGAKSADTGITSDGLLTVAAGELADMLTVTAIVADDPSKTATVEVEVRHPYIAVTGVTVNPSEVELPSPGDTTQLTVTVEPAEATEPGVIWESSDGSVATVTQDGLVEAIGEGEAWVSATASNGVSGSCKVTVPHRHVSGEPSRENEVAATCTKGGSYDLVTRCADCNEILESEHYEVGALGHDYAGTVVDHTWDEGGYTLHECSRCHDTYRDGETASLREAEEARAADVEAAIGALPAPGELALSDADAVAAARAAYDVLDERVRPLVTNLSTLEAAEARVADLSAAAAVDDAIEGLPDPYGLALGDAPAVLAARAAYEGLTDSQRELVTLLADLEIAEARVADLQAAAVVDDAIEGLPDPDGLALEDAPAVLAAKAAYEGLTDAQKGLVTLLADLEDAMARIAELQDEHEKEVADEAAAAAVDGAIAGLPAWDDLAADDAGEVAHVRSLYDALTDDQRALVEGAQALLAAEARVADLVAAAAVEEAIAALPDAGDAALPGATDAARAAYEALTDAQRALVKNLPALEDAEARVADLAAAGAVADAISALPDTGELTLGDAGAVAAAREAYEALTEGQKELVPNAADLVAAEERVAWLRATPIDGASVSVPATLNFTGTALRPEPTVTLAGETLVAGTDYDVSYKNNTKVGTATVTVTGKGAYKGQATATFQIRQVWWRLAGQNALDTMQAIAGESSKTSYAVVTTNADFRDALAASALAGRYDALVLTTPKGSAATQTKDALKAAGVKTVFVVGSKSDVSDVAMNALKSGTGVTKVTRVANKSGVSAKAIELAKACGKRSDTVIIASQASFKDALSIAPYSYATKSPILYAESNKQLSAATLKYIKDNRYSKAIIVGGPVALPSSVDSQLTKSAGIKSGSITRLAGSNPYDTSLIIAQWATGAKKNGSYGTYQGKALAYVRFQPGTRLSANRLAVATGQGWKDALCGAAVCGRNRSVLLLGDATNYARATSFCADNREAIAKAYVLGGTSAVSGKVWDALLASTAG